MVYEGEKMTPGQLWVCNTLRIETNCDGCTEKEKLGNKHWCNCELHQKLCKPFERKSKVDD